MIINGAIRFTVLVTLTPAQIHQLDLAPLETKIAELVADPRRHARSLAFQFAYPREEGDPRELSEIEEIRLWCIRVDSTYPWLPYFLDWKSGELTRWAAMLVPHRFDTKEGLIFNTQALEIFVLSKVFGIHHWLSSQGIQNHADLRYFAQSLGYDLEPSFFSLL